jgi:hypothetical protein
MVHIAFISYDRYLSVSKPLQYNQKQSNSFSVSGLPTYLILGFIWLYSTCAWIPAILYTMSNSQDKLKDIPIEILEAYRFLNISLDTAHTNQILLIDNVSPNIVSKSLSECNIQARPALVIPHSLIVYFLPMITIFVFYTKTIFIVNHKMDPRRTSVITKVNSQSRFSNKGSSSNLENFSFGMLNRKFDIQENFNMSLSNISIDNIDENAGNNEKQIK